MYIEIVKDYQAMSTRAANLIKDVITKKRNANLVLATGNTPIGTYQALVEMYDQKQISFGGIKSFNLDEYVGVSVENPISFRYFMNHHLFSKVDIMRENIFFPHAPTKDESYLKKYNRALDTMHEIDLLLMGTGTNGHIAFNEPGTDWSLRTHFVDLDEQTIKDNFGDSPEKYTSAITMGIKDILRAKKIVMLINGAKKADAVKRIVEGKEEDINLPASALFKHPNVTIIITEDATTKLRK